MELSGVIYEGRQSLIGPLGILLGSKQNHQTPHDES